MEKLWQSFPLGWPIVWASCSLRQVLCPLAFFPYDMCFPNLHDEELDDDEENENEEGDEAQQQVATILPHQPHKLTIRF